MANSPLRPALLLTAALLLGAAGETGRDSIDGRANGAFGAFLAGRAAVQSSDFGTAAREFEQALRDDPSVPELTDQAFLAALLAGRAEAAQLAVALPDNALAQLLLANRDGGAGHWSAAQARYAALRPEAGVNGLLRPALVAWATFGAGDTDAALAILTPLAEGTRFRGLYALHAAMIADQASRAPIAERFYAIAAADFGPVNLRTAVILASWQARNGQLEGAQRTLSALANADGEFAMSRQALIAAASAPAVSSPADGIAELYLAMAATLRQQNNGSAEAIVRLALGMRPDLTAARILLSDLQASAKRPEEAQATLAGIPATDPLTPLVQLRRAALMDDLGDQAGAIKLLEQVASAHSDRSEPLAQLGDLLRRQSRFAEAARAYDGAIDKIGVPSRGNWALFYARGISLDRSGQWPKAEADLRFALELAPDQPSVLNYLAYSWAERGEHLDEARGMLQRAMAARTNEGAYVDSLGWTLLRQGDTTGAIRELERAVEMEPEDATINGHLGDALAAAGRMREAEFQWRRALNLKPEADEAAALNAKLAKLAENPAPTPVAAPNPGVSAKPN